MRHLVCPVCSGAVYFENFSCIACGTPLAFSSRDMEMKPLVGQHAALACANRTGFVCNWATADSEPLCPSCRLDEVIPNLSYPDNVVRWRRIEIAKRRALVDLLRLGLPIVTRRESPTRGLAFQFLSNMLAAHPVKTGHSDGLVTLDIAEADDSEREARRAQMGEPYRTLVGHFRHEIAHYYWTLLIQDSSDLRACRAVFGDERDDYQAALKRHYAEGAPPAWAQHFISAYASTHPWEDWAETFAHFLHIVATMDTALQFGMIGPRRAPIADPYREADFDALIRAFVPVTEAVNEINRSMGQPDVYPFVLTPEVVGKLHFIHMIVRKAADAHAREKRGGLQAA
ncbi:MAG: putative zinc-binding metallopeptidase [Hyphomicrobiales bacterium]|nr:putative zinc-binding metallopeptidase [Hyphomicrobiales bacterium]